MFQSINVSPFQILSDHHKNFCFSPFQFQEKEKTNSGYKHNSKISHGTFNLTFRMLQHTFSEVTVTKYDEILKDQN